MAGNDPVFMQEMIGIFRKQIDELSVALPAYLEKKDFDALSKAAHKAKSSVAIMGMNTEAELLKRLELLSRQGRNTEEYGEIVSTFIQRSKLAVEELENINLNE
jgi:HPt (histidine-containing phosphotransfer) domain-containing protein